MLDKMMHVCGKQFYNIPMKYFFLQSYHSRLDILHFRCTQYLRLKLNFQCLRMSYCISRCLMLREVFILGINSSLLTDQFTSLLLNVILLRNHMESCQKFSKEKLANLCQNVPKVRKLSPRVVVFISISQETEPFMSIEDGVTTKP